MTTLKGRISKLSIDKDTGEVFGLSLDKVEGYFNFSKPEYRKQPWDVPKVDAVVEISYATADNGKRYISTIERLDEESEVPPWESGDMGYDEDMNLRAPKAERLAEVVTAEQARNRSISRQVAMKCAADVAVAWLEHPRTGEPIPANEDVCALIDAVLDRFLDKVE